jgi:hypothetical protein
LPARAVKRCVGTGPRARLRSGRSAPSVRPWRAGGRELLDHRSRGITRREFPRESRWHSSCYLRF